MFEKSNTIIEILFVLLFFCLDNFLFGICNVVDVVEKKDHLLIYCHIWDKDGGERGEF